MLRDIKLRTGILGSPCVVHTLLLFIRKCLCGGENLVAHQLNSIILILVRVVQ